MHTPTYLRSGRAAVIVKILLAATTLLLGSSPRSQAAAPTISINGSPSVDPIREFDTTRPFTSVSITADGNVNLAIVMDPPNAGTFSDSDWNRAGGIYVYDGSLSAADAVTELESLVFTPNDNLAPEYSGGFGIDNAVPIEFTVAVSDTSGSDTDSVIVELRGSNNDPSVNSFLFAVPSTLNDTETTRPFSNANINDFDGDELTAIITIQSDSTNVGETVTGIVTHPPDNSVVTDLTGGVYEIANQLPNDLQAILRALEFNPDDNQLDVLGPGSRPRDFGVTIKLQVADGAGLYLEEYIERDVSVDVWPFNDPPVLSGADTFGSPSASPSDPNRVSIPDKFVDVAEATAVDDLITTIGPHDLAVDTEVRLLLPPGVNSFPADLPDQSYFVIADGDSEDNTLKLSTSQGGSAVDLQSDLGPGELQLAAVSNLELFHGLSVSDDDNRGTQPVRVVVSLVRLSENEAGDGEGNDLSDSPLGMFYFPDDPGRDPTPDFQLQGTQAGVTAQLQGVRFVPESNLLPVGEEYLLKIAIIARDVVPNGDNLEKFADESFPPNDPAIFWIESINDPPTIAAGINPSSVLDTQLSINPFRVKISDPDPLDDAFRVAMDLDQGNGTYGSANEFGSLFPVSPEFPQLVDPPKYLSATDIEFGVAGVSFRPIKNSTDTTELVSVRFSITDRHGLDGLPDIQTLEVVGVNDPPDILSFSNPLFFVNDDKVLLPFEDLRIDDVDSDSVDASFSFQGPAGLPTLAMFYPSGPFTDETPEDITDLLSEVEFRPNDGIIPTGDSESVTLTITVTDDGGKSQTKTATVVIMGVNSPPVITFTPPLGPDPRNISPDMPMPFKTVEITDDGTDPITVEIALANAGVGVLEDLGGFVESAPGVYSFTGAPGDAAAAMNGMSFVPSDTYPFPPNQPIEAEFQIQATDVHLKRTRVSVAVVLAEASRNLLVWETGDDTDSAGKPVRGTLRYAVSKAHRGDHITMALPEYPNTIRLSSPIVFERNVTIKGPGADKLTLSGDTNGDGTPDTQLFQIQATVVLEGLTLTKGVASSGGAIAVEESGYLTLRGCAVTDSIATLWGGGIDVNLGGLVVENSLIHGNEVNSDSGRGGGGIAVYSAEPIRIHNTTFAGNRQSAISGVGGGALYVENATPETPFIVTVSHNTFAENVDAADQGSSLLANVFGTEVHVFNSIFADRQGRNLQIKGAADVISLGGNISDDTALSFLVQAGIPKAVQLLDHPRDRTELDPRLLPLATHGAPTAHYPLADVSPAIDTSYSTPELRPAAIDQLQRIRDAIPDVGAIEYSSLDLVDQDMGPQQIVINEIQFNDNPDDFIELYVPRDVGPTDLSGFGLWVDGIERHVFATDTVLVAGSGIVVAESMITTPTPISLPNAPPAEVVVASLELTLRSVVELRRPDAFVPDGRVVAQANYVGEFVNPNLDPDDASQPADIGDNSITLVPQFMGFALLPHEIVDCATQGAGDVQLLFSSLGNGIPSSPGADNCGNAFGEINSTPIAVADSVIVSEDLVQTIYVLENDFDADGADRLVVTGVGGNENGPFGPTGMSEALVDLEVIPNQNPVRGKAVEYDPIAALTHLSEGIEARDQFYYLIADIGTGVISEFEDPGAGNDVIVVSPGHRLIDGTEIRITGGDYEGVHTVGEILDANNMRDPDRFTLQSFTYIQNAAPGTWETIEPRSVFDANLANDPHQGVVTVTVLGANDPPWPQPDTATTTEDQILRLMADPHLAGSTSLVMDTDDLYPEPRAIWSGSLLRGQAGAADDDFDVDDDDDATSLHVVGVTGEVFDAIDGYSPVPDGTGVVVHAVNHGLEDGTTILIAGYTGHPSYNGFHEITLEDADSFSIPIDYVDNVDTPTDLWTILNDENRLSATSELGASVALEIREDRKESNVIYNPRASAYLNGLADTESEDDTFYYAVQDRHGAIGIARVMITVEGVNDDPLPVADPGSLAELSPLLGDDTPLEQVLSEVGVDFYIPPFSGLPQRSDVSVLTPDGESQSILLTDLYTTDQDTLIVIPATGPDGLLANDNDPDRNDLSGLTVTDVSGHSREGATISLDTGTQLITYDPTTPTALSIFDVQSVDAASDVLETELPHGLVGGEAVAVTAKNGQPLPEAVAGQKRYYVLPANLGLNTLQLSPAPGGAPVDFTSDVGVGHLEIRFGNHLRMLARGEAVVDTFETTVSDGQGGEVPTLVAVLVTGKNDSPIARDDSAETLEDQILSLPRLPEELALIPEVEVTPLDQFGVLANDTDPDINGVVPDDKLALVSIRNLDSRNRNEPDLGSSLWAISPETGATLTLAAGQLTYDPTTSTPEDFRYLKSLAAGESLFEEFVYTVMDGSFVFAVNDVFKVAADNANVFLPVLANDRNLTGNGQNLHIVEVGTPSNGGETEIALDAEDNTIGITYSPQVDYVGNEYFTYLVSDEDGNTDRAVVAVRVTVNQLNGNLQANDDHFSVARGQSSPLDVLANDNIIPQSGVGLILTRIFSDPNDPDSAVEIPESGSVDISLPSGNTLTVEDNQLTFVQDFDSFLTDDSASFAYEISGGGIARATAQVDVTIFDRTGTLKVRNDWFGILAGSESAPLDVLANDNILPGSIAELRIISMSEPNHGSLALDEAGTTLFYTPSPGFVGQDSFTYDVTDDLGGTGENGVVTVTVGSLATNADFLAAPYDDSDDNDDTFNAANAEEVVLDVLANDRILQAAGRALEIAGVSPTSVANFGRIRVDDDNRFLLFNPAFEAVGERTFTYSVRDGSGNTTDGSLTIVIVRHGAAANADFFTVNVDSQENELDVLLNDVAFPPSSEGLSIVGVGTGLDAPNHGGIVTINEEGTRLLYTPASGFKGEETFTYTMTDTRQTDTTKVVVRVDSGLLSANADEFTVFYDPLPMDKVVLFDDAGGLLGQIGRSGIADGEFEQPSGVARRGGRIAVADTGNDRVQIFDNAGNLLQIVGAPGSGPGQFDAPAGVALMNDLRLVVADTGNHRIQIFDDQGNFLARFGSAGNSPGHLNNPADVAVLADDSIVVADTGNDRIQIFDDQGNLLTQFGNSGNRPGEFNAPAGVGVDATDQIWIADTGNHRIQKFAADGTRLETFGDFGAGLGEFNLPADVAADAAGRILIADTGNHRIQIRGTTGQYTTIDSFLTGGEPENFHQPAAIAVTNTGDFAVVNRREQSLRQFTLPVLANDRVLPDFGQSLTITGVGINDPILPNPNEQNAPDRLGSVEISPDGGSLIYIPRDENGSFPYVEQFTYEISDGTERRAVTAVTIHVERRTHLRDMETNDDAFTVQSDSQNNILAVLANDDIKPAGATAWSITEVSEVQPAVSDPDRQKDVLTIQGQVLLYTPEPGFVGTKTFYYDVSDGIGGTGRAQVTITVGDLPVCPDEFVALSGFDSTPPEEIRLDVLANDNMRPALAQGNPDPLDDFILPDQVISPDQGGSAAVVDDEDGLRYISYTPADNPPANMGYPYREMFTYVVESDSGEPVEGQAVVTVHAAGSDRAAAVLTVEVIGVNDVPIVQGIPVDGGNLSVYHQLGIHPYAGITVTDFDAGDQLCIRVELDTLANGTLIPSTDPDCEDQNDDPLIYEVCGLTPEQAEHCLRELVFMPAGNASPGNPAETVLTLSITDETGNGLLNHQTTIQSHHPQIARREAGDGDRNDEFGFSVDAARDTIVAGAPFDDDSLTGEVSFNKTGSAYVYDRNHPTPKAWGEAAKVLAADATNGDEFGHAVAISGDGNTMVVGARKDEHNGFNTGSAYVMQRNATDLSQWDTTFKLLPPDGASSDEFGSSVAISRDGNTIVVGAIHNRNGNAGTGSAYVFERNLQAAPDEDLWIHVDKLFPADGANDDEYGRAVAISKPYILVGAPRHTPTNKRSGAAYLYKYDGQSWMNLIGKFQPSRGDNGDEFGHSVTIDEDHFAVGAPLDEAGGQKSGTVYVYGLGVGNLEAPFPSEDWGLVTFLQSATAADFDEFGYSVALDGHLLLVGARHDEVNGRRSGSVSVYHREDPSGIESWNLLEELRPDEVNTDDEFGYSLAFDRGTAVVGARREESVSGKRYGAIYIYRFKFNNRPTLATLPPGDIALEVGDFRIVTIFASDPDQHDAVVSVEVQPTNLPWLVYDAGTMELILNEQDILQNLDVGTYTVTLKATDEDGASTTKVLNIEVLPARFLPEDSAASAQLAWVATNLRVESENPQATANLWGAWSDPDLDGRLNFQEYAFGSDPMQADSNPADLAIVLDRGIFYVVHLRRTNDPGLSYVLEASGDLQAWISAETWRKAEHVAPMDAEFEEVWVELNSEAMPPGLFFRVRVESSTGGR